MACKAGKSKHKAKPGRYQCGRCGAVAKKGKSLCAPQKIKKGSQ